MILKKDEMESLNAEVLANLSVEELEQRLEMQVLHMPEACWTCSCDSDCPTYVCTANNYGCDDCPYVNQC